MKANLNSLGDGIIVLGLGAFLFSIAYLYSQSISQSSQNYIVYVTGFFALSLALLVAGVLKIANAFSSVREEKVSTLKTPVAAFIIGLVWLYYGLLFLYRF
jgi:EamA domain-containing membrane protein RarD